jgi:hypothetical protein
VKGYTKVSGDKVDFQVASRTPRSSRWRGRTGISSIRGGRIEVFMLPATVGDLMWRGIARAALDMTLTPTQRRERIARA